MKNWSIKELIMIFIVLVIIWIVYNWWIKDSIEI